METCPRLACVPFLENRTLEPTLLDVGVLGLLGAIRTFLRWSLMVEIEGRWPWQRRALDRVTPGARSIDISK